VYPFPLLSDREEFRIGNIFYDDLRQMWESSPILHAIREVSFEKSQCGRLGCNKVCGLWARSNSISWSGQLDGKTPCELTGWQ
jgi:MoaA/NifB/PqqE/SkfB family radical SAM enzyme